MKNLSILIMLFSIHLGARAQNIFEGANFPANEVNTCQKLNRSNDFIAMVDEWNLAERNTILHLIKIDKFGNVAKKVSYKNFNTPDSLQMKWSRFIKINEQNEVFVFGSYKQHNKYGIFMKKFDSNLNLLKDAKLELGNLYIPNEPSKELGVNFINVISKTNAEFYFALSNIKFDFATENSAEGVPVAIGNLILLTDEALNEKSRFSENLYFANPDTIPILSISDIAINPSDSNELVVLKRQNFLDYKSVTIYTLTKNLAYKERYQYRRHYTYSSDTNIVFPHFDEYPNLASLKDKLLVSGYTYDITKDTLVRGEANPANVFSLQTDSFTVIQKYLFTNQNLFKEIEARGSQYYGLYTYFERRMVVSKTNAIYLLNRYYNRVSNPVDTIKYGFNNTWLMITKLDYDFKVIWQKSIDFTYTTSAADFTTNENGIMISGKFYYKPTQIPKAFLYILDTLGNPITSLPDIENKRSNKAVVYPNPSKGNFTFEVVNSQIKSMDVYDVSGRLIIKENLTNPTESHQLNLSNYANGMYFYSIVLTDGTSSSGKLLKE